MSTIEAGLAELGLLDDVLAGCAETGMSLTAFLRDRLSGTRKVEESTSVDATIVSQVHE